MEILFYILIAIIASFGVFVIFGRLFEKYLTARIESSVQHKYDLKLENYKIEHEKRLKAQLLAELLSEWIAVPMDEKLMNRLTFEAFIWLPEDIATKLSATLSHKAGAPTAKDLIVEVRKLILENDDAITANSIIHFSKIN